MKNKLISFMAGRYGNDSLNRFLSIVSLVALIVSIVSGISALYWISVAVLALSVFRMFSKNRLKRGAENYAYLRARNKLTGKLSGYIQRLRQRKTHRFFRCPSCRVCVRVPKGRGRIRISCPKCGASFEKKT